MRILGWYWLLALSSLVKENDGFLNRLEEDSSYDGQEIDGAEYYSDGDNSTGVLGSDNIYEWTPISTNISAGERNVFIFSVNSNRSGLSIIPTFEVLIFLSGNICKQPSDTTDKTLRVSYSFDEAVMANSSIGDFTDFSSGYMQALATSPLNGSNNESVATYSNLYVIIEPVNSTTNQPLVSNSQTLSDVWYYKLSVSENDLVYQWDTRKWLDVLDTDHTSALLSTDHGLSVIWYLDGVSEEAQYNNTVIDSSLYDMYLYSQEEAQKIEASLNHSLCAVTLGPYLATSVNSTIGADEKIPLDNNNLAIFKSAANRTWHSQEQFYITGLNSSSNYTVYLTKKIGRSGNLSSAGGVLFSNSNFTTRDSDACSLIFDLDFCSGVAYSVPNTVLAPNNKTFLATLYDELAEASFANFSKALQNIACDTVNDAIYSPLRTCEDCANSYRNWLCAVTIPRCSAGTSDYYAFRDKDNNRNNFLNDLVKPYADYYEILPCIEMCYSIVRDCPSVFQFACPSATADENLLLSSYNFYNISSSVMQCNFIGNDTDIFLSLLH